MTEPWSDPAQFGAWYGSIAGPGIGILGGVLGGLTGTLAPRGVGRVWILGLMYAMVVLGVAQLAFGIAALAAGQPYGIWYGPVLCGAVSSLVFGALVPVVRLRYRQAEERRLDAAAFRAG